MKNEGRRPLFSIITVCLNAESGVVKTMRSVFKQDCREFEYIVIDGGSTDRTLEIVSRACESFQKKNISFQCISEKDSGTYNAMNKGIGMAQGEWICFLNAGDWLCERNILSRVISFFGQDIDVLYGDTILRLGKYKKIRRADKLENIVSHMVFSHQSVFVRRDVQRAFNEIYQISADYDFFLECFLEQKNMCYVGFPISVFALDGPSSTERSHAMLENIMIQQKKGVLSENRLRRELGLRTIYLLMENIYDNVEKFFGAEMRLRIQKMEFYLKAFRRCERIV